MTRSEKQIKVLTHISEANPSITIGKAFEMLKKWEDLHSNIGKCKLSLTTQELEAIRLMLEIDPKATRSEVIAFIKTLRKGN